MGHLKGEEVMSVKPQWEQGPDAGRACWLNQGLISILGVEALKQMVGVEVEGCECHENRKNWELIGR